MANYKCHTSNHMIVMVTNRLLIEIYVCKIVQFISTNCEGNTHFQSLFLRWNEMSHSWKLNLLNRNMPLSSSTSH